MEGRALILAALLLSGCATLPYRNGSCEPPGEGHAEDQLEWGTPRPLVDGLGHYVFSLPSKLLLLSWKVGDHRVSAETEAELVAYLEENGLCRVKVRVNQYAPGGEWARLRSNREVAAGWRYSLGALSWLSYTVFPQRLFGGDNYNPWTDTLSLYSDSPAIALHEGGHVKDFARRRFRGSYAALRFIPLVPLYQESVATGDALGYLRTHRSLDEQRQGYHLLWGAWGSYVAGEANQWVPAPIWLTYAVSYGTSWLGKLAGFVRGRYLDPERAPGESPTGRIAQEGVPVALPTGTADRANGVGPAPELSSAGDAAQSGPQQSGQRDPQRDDRP